MYLSARTLKLHYSKALHIFITEFFKNNLHYENRLVLCILRSKGSWKLFWTQSIQNIKPCLTKSIGLFWFEHLLSIDSKYFSFEGYTCKSTLFVQLITI